MFDSISFADIGLVIGVGIIAGFINTLAGSGSLLTLPVLTMMGLPANVANGTNRIAILVQGIVSVTTFKREGIFSYKEVVRLAIPTIIGSIIGANIALSLNDAVMKLAIGLLILVMLTITIIKPDRWMKKDGEGKPFGVLQIIVFLFIGVYGGFIQAGIGFFLLAGLLMACGFNLVKANAIKNALVLAYTPFALTIFIYSGHVNFLWGCLLAIGNALGAFVASKLAIQKGAPFIRYFLMLALVMAALKMFNLI